MCCYGADMVSTGSYGLRLQVVEIRKIYKYLETEILMLLPNLER